MTRNIHITSMDQERLLDMIETKLEFGSKRNHAYLNKLKVELSKAVIVASEDIPDDLITMNSSIKLKDITHDEELVYTLVYPDKADLLTNMISILSPIGTALIGYSKGDMIDWVVPDGIIQLEVTEVLYQPEAHGQYQL